MVGYLGHLGSKGQSFIVMLSAITQAINYFVEITGL